MELKYRGITYSAAAPSNEAGEDVPMRKPLGTRTDIKRHAAEALHRRPESTEMVYRGVRYTR